MLKKIEFPHLMFKIPKKIKTKLKKPKNSKKMATDQQDATTTSLSPLIHRPPNRQSPKQKKQKNPSRQEQTQKMQEQDRRERVQQARKRPSSMSSPSSSTSSKEGKRVHWGKNSERKVGRYIKRVEREDNQTIVYMAIAKAMTHMKEDKK